MKLCVFDFDSTLMDGETIDQLAAACGQVETVSRITAQAMAGELDFFQSLTERVQRLAGLSYETAVSICENLPLMPGAMETVHALKKQGYRVVIFSGGFQQATHHFRALLGADADFANRLHHRDGVLTGLVGGEMMFNDSKGSLLSRLQQLLGISAEKTIVVGDGANDISMFAHAACKIAFCAKPVLKAHANIIVDEKNLQAILPHIPAI